MNSKQLKPARLAWRNWKVAATWPEGCVVIKRLKRSKDGYGLVHPYAYEITEWFRPDWVDETDPREYALIALPKIKSKDNHENE